MRWGLVAVLMLAVVVVGVAVFVRSFQASFRDPGTDAVMGTNNTGIPLTFEMELVNPPNQYLKTVPYGPRVLRPGMTGGIVTMTEGEWRAGYRVDFDKNGCSVGHLVARAPNGREIARHAPGLCIDDTWVIEPAT